MKFVNIGFGNFVSVENMICVVSPDSAPIKRLIHDSDEEGLLINASFGRKTESVIVESSHHVILSSLTPDEVNERIAEVTKQ